MEKQLQVQVKRQSGRAFDFNLDEYSFKCLMEAQEIHAANGNNFSQSVIIRAAIRLYAGELARKQIQGAYEKEAVETKRASKGII